MIPTDGKPHIPNHYKTAAKTSKINFCDTSRARTPKIKLKKKQTAKNVEKIPADYKMDAAPEKYTLFPHHFSLENTKKQNTGAIFTTPLGRNA